MKAVIDGPQLFKKVEPYRHENALLDGDLVPKSIVLLKSMLDAELDPDNRYRIYGNILVECRLADRTKTAVKFAKARLAEFRDITSLISYSSALTSNGDFEAGVASAKEALHMAIERRTLVNFAAGNLVRASIKTGSVSTVNKAIETLIESTSASREGDCVLETDWTDRAEALGANKELIAWVRLAAARR